MAKRSLFVKENSSKMTEKEKMDNLVLFNVYKRKSQGKIESLSMLKKQPEDKIESVSKSSSPEEKDVDMEDIDKSDNTRKNPERKAKMMVSNYYENPENEEDRLIFCDNCNQDVLDYCPTCGMLVMINDVPIPMGAPDRARKTAPALFEIRSSRIHGLGVFARRQLPSGMKFGPYEGIFTRVNTTNGYSWKLKNGKLVDAADETRSNWMRYVNCSPHMSLQNVVAFQYKGELFYRTARTIEKGEELLVYYGNSFAKELGIEPKRYFDPKVEAKLEIFYSCRHCRMGLSSKKYRDEHELRCRFKIKLSSKEEEKFECKYCKSFLTTENVRDTHEKYCKSKPRLRDTKKIQSRAAPILKIKNDLKKYKIKKDEMFLCDHCDYQTVYKGCLKRHFNIHFPNPIFVCKFCDKKFSSKWRLEGHYVCKHSENLSQVTFTNKINICGVCGYKIIGSLKRHNKKHQGFDESSFQCQICQRLFKVKYNFKKHLDTHSGIKKMVCLGCGRRFNSKQNLDHHIIVKHVDNNHLLKTVTSKIHSCSHCQYRTCNSTQLVKHRTKCFTNFRL